MSKYPSDEYIHDQINYGVRSFLTWTNRNVPREYFDEMISEAWCRYLSTENQEEKDNPKRCAKRAAHTWWNKEFQQFALYIQDDIPDMRGDSSRRGLSHTVSADLFNHFYHCRKNGGRRAMEAAVRDTLICDLISQGLNNEGIANELKLSVNSIKEYRKKIRRSLTEYATISIPDDISEIEGELSENENLFGIFDLFYQSRQRKGKREKKAAIRDTLIFLLRREGYRIKEIALKLNLSDRSVERYWMIINRRLQQDANRQCAETN